MEGWKQGGGRAKCFIFAALRLEREKTKGRQLLQMKRACSLSLTSLTNADNTLEVDVQAELAVPKVPLYA